MPRILLTRPRDDSETLARRLAALGYDSLVEPLLVIKKSDAPPPDMRDAQAVLATSAHAFDFFHTPYPELLGLPCYCVGPRTAAAAKKAGFAKVIDADGDGEELAGQVAASLDAGKGDLLYLSARDTDGGMEGVLLERGFSLNPWVLYAAEPAADFSFAAIAAFRDKSLDAVLVFSARTAETLERLILKHRLEDACKNVIALGISDAVRQRLQKLPWRRLDAAPHTTEEAAVRRLQDILPVS